MSIRELLAKAVDGFVRIDASRKHIHVTEQLLRIAAKRTAGSDLVSDLQLEIGDSIHIEARSHGGKIISADLIPQALEVSNGSARVTGLLRGGVRVGHEKAWRTMVTRACAAVTGAASSRLNDLEGVTVEGDRVVYERPVSALALATSLGLSDGDAVVPLAVKPGALIVDVSAIRLPTLSKVATALVSAMTRAA